MNVTIQCRTSPSRPGIVYATTLDENGEGIIGATLDYCLSAAQERGHIVTNAQEVLMWLHKNTDFVAHP